MVNNEIALRCRSLVKTYGAVYALNGLDIDLPQGNVLALLGPSGCGKTTALRVIAGFESPDSGTVEIGGRMVTEGSRRTPPEKRNIGLVFQDYALFPHLTVAKNVSYGAKPAYRGERMAELFRLVGLEGLEKRYPYQLSGGQQQRVALARTLASEPDVLLLDEPFSNLDVKLRVQVREEVRRIIRAAGTTSVFVTHDQEEAFVLADTIIVMNAGRVEQAGTAEELYRRPATRFVAGFVGTASFVPAELTGGMVESELGGLPTNDTGSGPRDLLVRPDDIVLGTGSREATIVSSEFHGHERLYRLRLPSGSELVAVQHGGPSVEAGASILVSLREHEPVVFSREGTEEGEEPATVG